MVRVRRVGDAQALHGAQVVGQSVELVYCICLKHDASAEARELAQGVILVKRQTSATEAIANLSRGGTAKTLRLSP